MSRRIAIVEDEPSIRENYADLLRRQGYAVQGYAARPEALAAFRQRLPDLAILDIGLDGDPEGGFDLCRELRALSATVPIIFLTARDHDLDVISGLRLGADDYLTKDISLPLLSARVAALFRRTDALGSTPMEEDLVHAGELHLDIKRLSAHWQDSLVDLTVTEFWIVHALARRPGHVRSRDQLMGDADTVVDGATVTSHIKRIRRKLAAAGADPGCIETVYGMGYRWTAAS